MEETSSLRPLWPGFAYKHHQVVGVNWMIAREAAKPAGGILADEMGLGKTIQMLGLIRNAAAAKSTTLLIAPVAVLTQWEDVARKTGLTVLKPKTVARRTSWEVVGTFRPMAPRLHLIGYEAARSKKSLVESFAWDRLICDEAHRLGSKSGLHEMVGRITATARWFLTATPVVNGLKDLAHLLQLVGVADARVLAGTTETLEPLLKELVLARSMEQLRAVLPDLPPPAVRKTVCLPFKTEAEAEFYRGMSGVIVRRWQALEADGGAGAALMKLKLFMRLRQLSLHPQVYIDARRKAAGPIGYERPDWVGSSTKFDAIAEHITAGATAPHKWIVFCHFHPEMELLQSTLKALPSVRRVWMYNGTLTHGARADVLAETLEPPTDNRADVLLIQLQSGGVGLNLQHFDRIVFSGPWWTSALMEQAIGRAVRIGQRETVLVYHLLLEEEAAMNIDAIMTEKAESKGELNAAVLGAACRDC